MNFKEQKMGLVSYAKQELKIAGLFDKDSDYGGMLGDAVMELMEVFAKQGHSECSASMALSIFNKVAAYKPLSPLTFGDDEWIDTGRCFQNKRDSAVFKESKDKGIRRESLLVAAELYEKIADKDNELRLYNRFLKYFPKPVEEALEINTKVAALYLAKKQRKKYMKTHQ